MDPVRLSVLFEMSLHQPSGLGCAVQMSDVLNLVNPLRFTVFFPQYAEVRY